MGKVWALGGVGLVLLSFFLGMRYAEGRQAVAHTAAVERALVQAQAIWDEDRKLLLETQQVIERTREVVRYVQQEARELDMEHCPSLGVDWLRLRNESIDAANRAASGRLSDALPAPASDGQR